MKPHTEGHGKAGQTLSSVTLKGRPTLLCQSKKKKNKRKRILLLIGKKVSPWPVVVQHCTTETAVAGSKEN